MKFYNLRITEWAEEDLEMIGDYITYELKVPETAIQMVEGLQKEVRKLSYLPERHELDEDSKLAGIGVRKQYYRNYKIFYLIEEKTEAVIVLRILHMRVDSRAALYRTFNL